MDEEPPYDVFAMIRTSVRACAEAGNVPKDLFLGPNQMREVRRYTNAVSVDEPPVYGSLAGKMFGHLLIHESAVDGVAVR